MKCSLKTIAHDHIKNRMLLCKEVCVVMKESHYRQTFFDGTTCNAQTIDISGDSNPQEIYCYIYKKVEEEEGSPIEQLLHTFVGECIKWDLPIHNPIAFFMKIFEIEQMMLQQDGGLKALRNLLILALSDGGFVFSTRFDFEQSNHLRPSDVSIPVNYPSDDAVLSLKLQHQYAIQAHAQLSSRYGFGSSLSQLRKDVLLPLRDIPSQHAAWEEVFDNCKETKDLHITPWLIYGFFVRYRDYCLLQDPFANPTLIRMQMRHLYHAGSVILKLDEFYQDLMLLLKNVDNLSEKVTWLQSFKTYLSYPKTKAGLKAIDNYFMPSSQSENEMDLLLEGALMVFTQENPSLDKFPLLNQSKPSFKLCAVESKILTHYQKCCLFKCIKGIEKTLKNPSLHPIAPLYLTNLFIHKKNPLEPFTKKKYPFSKKSLQYTTPSTSGITSSNQYQFAHQYLLKAMTTLCSSEESREIGLAMPNAELCEYLFLRHSSFIAIRKNAQFPLSEYLRTQFHNNPMESILEALDYLIEFPFTNLPRYSYAPTAADRYESLIPCSAEEDKANRRMVKILKEILSPEKIEAYCNLAFCHSGGIGLSVHPYQWHIDMANWLESIIDANEQILKYIEPPLDEFYPGSRMSMNEINATITWNPGEELDASMFSPNLARVQLTIQQLCIQAIYEELKPQILALYKRIFFNGSSPSDKT